MGGAETGFGLVVGLRRLGRDLDLRLRGGLFRPLAGLHRKRKVLGFVLDQGDRTTFQLADPVPGTGLDADDLTGLDFENSALNTHHQIGVELEGGDPTIIDDDLDCGVMGRAYGVVRERNQDRFALRLLALLEVIGEITVLRPGREQNLLDADVKCVLQLVGNRIGHGPPVDIGKAGGAALVRSVLLAFGGFDEARLPVTSRSQEEGAQGLRAFALRISRLQVSAPLHRCGHVRVSMT